MTRPPWFHEHVDRIELDAVDATLSQLSITFLVDMVLSNADVEMTVRIETAFTVRKGDECMRLVPDEPASLSPLLGIIRSSVEKVVAHKSGRLEITFADGLILSVESDASYESWQLTDNFGTRIVSIPGGGLATWLPSIPGSD